MKWPFESIGNLAKVNPRIAAADRPAPDEQVSFVPMAAISEKTCRIEEQTERCFAEVSKGYTPFRRGDVLIAKITPCFENGKMALAENLSHELGFGTTEFHVLRPSDKLIGAYLFNLLRAPFIRKAGAMKMKGAAGQRRVPADFFAALQIPLPPLAEQKRIAAILDAADALRAKRRETLAQLDTLLQSTFLDMFGDPVTNPMGWGQHEVDNICLLVRGSSPRPKGDPLFYGGPVPRLMIADITRDGFYVTPKIDSLTDQGAKKSRPVPTGTVVMAVSGDVGVVAAVQVPCCVHDGFVAFLDLDKAVFDSCFFMFQFHFMKSTHEQRKAGAIFQNLTTKDIKAMQLPAPPLPLQRRFATIVESVEQQKSRLRAHLAELDTLFASLQDRAFKGAL